MLTTFSSRGEHSQQTVLLPYWEHSVCLSRCISQMCQSCDMPEWVDWVVCKMRVTVLAAQPATKVSLCAAPRQQTVYCQRKVGTRGVALSADGSVPGSTCTVLCLRVTRVCCFFLVSCACCCLQPAVSHHQHTPNMCLAPTPHPLHAHTTQTHPTTQQTNTGAGELCEWLWG